MAESESKSKSLTSESESESSKNELESGLESESGLEYYKSDNLSTKVNEVFEGEEGRWTKVVKRQVNKSIESVSENTEEVHNN